MVKSVAQPEADLKRAIVEALKRIGLRVVMRNEQLSRGNYRGGCGKGSSDIFIVLPPNGRFLAMEVKFGDGKATSDQLAFGQDVVEAGGAFALVRSVAEAIDAVRRAMGRRAA